MQAAWDLGENLLLLASETPQSDGRGTAPQLVLLDLDPVLVQDDVLQIQYRGAELKLPAGVDMDAVAGSPEFPVAHEGTLYRAENSDPQWKTKGSALTEKLK